MIISFLVGFGIGMLIGAVIDIVIDVYNEYLTSSKAKTLATKLLLVIFKRTEKLVRL